MIQDITVAVLEREISERDIGKHVRRFKTEHYKKYDNLRRMLSLDHPAPGREGRPLTEIIPG